MKTIISVVGSRNNISSVAEIDGELQERLEEYAARLELVKGQTYTIADIVRKIVSDAI